MIFGIRAVMEAVEAGKDIDKVLVKRELSGDLFMGPAVAPYLRDTLAGCLLNASTGLPEKNHQGVIAFTSAVTYQKLEGTFCPCYTKRERILLSLFWTG